MLKLKRSEFIKVIRDILQGDISYLKDANGNVTTTPSVIKYRTSGSTPDYPYVTVEMDSVITPQNNHVAEIYNDTQNRMEYIQFVMLPVTVRCYGEDSMDIMNKLKKILGISRYRDMLKVNAELSIQNLSNVVNTPTLHATKWVEGATFRLNFYTTEVFNDGNNTDSFFNDVNTSGEIDGNTV